MVTPLHRSNGKEGAHLLSLPLYSPELLNEMYLCAWNIPEIAEMLDSEANDGLIGKGTFLIVNTLPFRHRKR